MCLINPVARKRSIFKGKKKITVYKSFNLHIDTDNQLLMIGRWYSHDWEIGENVSTRGTNTKLTDWEKSNVCDGFHVYLTRKNKFYVAFTAYVKDYVCHSDMARDKFDGNTTTAVFTKLTLSKREYERIKKLLMKREEEYANV